jgi:hypothetical protein
VTATVVLPLIVRPVADDAPAATSRAVDWTGFRVHME